MCCGKGRTVNKEIKAEVKKISGMTLVQYTGMKRAHFFGSTGVLYDFVQSELRYVANEDLPRIISMTNDQGNGVFIVTVEEKNVH